MKVFIIANTPLFRICADCAGVYTEKTALQFRFDGAICTLNLMDANSPPKGTKCHGRAFGTKESHKRQGKTVSTPYDPQSAPDVVYLRNTGFALLALTVLAGAISVVGVLKTSQPLVMAQSAESAMPAALAKNVMPADDLLLQQIERNMFQREMLEAHYVNPKSI
jgi:hypothetical protein